MHCVLVGQVWASRLTFLYWLLRLSRIFPSKAETSLKKMKKKMGEKNPVW